MGKKLFSTLLVICMIVFGLMGFAACNDVPTPATPQKLSAPVVTLNGEVAEWNANTDADKFEISIDGNLSYVENTVTSKTLTDGQVLKVRAVGDGVNYSTSDWSNSVTYTQNPSLPEPTKLATPTVTVSNTGLASWSCENASSYVYKIDGGAETPTPATSVQLSNGQSIVVKAVGDGINYTDSDYSISKTYTEEGTPSNPSSPSDTEAPTYLGITASNQEPTASDTPPLLLESVALEVQGGSLKEVLENYYKDSDNSLGEAMPSVSDYGIYSSAGRAVYIQIWLDNPDQNTILSLKLNGTKYQSGGGLQSFFVEDGDSYLNCVYVTLTVPNGSYNEISYEVTEIEYVEGTNISQDGKAVFVDEDNDTVKIGLPYENYPSVDCGELEVGCHSVSVNVATSDISNLVSSKGYWLRAILLDENGVARQELLSANSENNLSFTGLTEEKEYLLAVFYSGDRNDGEGLSYNIIYSQSFTTNAVVTVDEYFLNSELFTEDGRNGAKITVAANISYDANAHFDRVEIYDGEALVLTDNEFEGWADYSNLNSKTKYTVKLYYSSQENGYTERVKEVSYTTPSYELPEIDSYSSDKNVVVGKHALFGFSVEKYIDLKYYDVIVRGYVQNDAYFAPFIVEMLDDPELLARLEQQAYDNYRRPNAYVWEAEYYMDLYNSYRFAWEHKENVGYSDDKWREIASSTEQYVYELSIDNEGLFVANDGDYVHNYYAVLRDYFAYEDLRFEIYLNVDLGDGEGIRLIKKEHAYPYFKEISDDYYGFSIEEDENVKNGFVFSETDNDYKTLYVYKLALYQGGELICYVPFSSTDITSVDMDTWLDEWIEKLKCEIPDLTVQQIIAKLGAETVKEIFDGLWFEEELGGDIVVDGNDGIIADGGSKHGNQRERELLTALSSIDEDTLLSLFASHTQEEKTLEAFILESDNATIINVLETFRNQFEITEQNAYAIYTAIDGVYDVYNQLKSNYENRIREEYAGKVITDRLEEIEKISFNFVLGTDLAPAGEYELHVLCRSLFKNYEGENTDEPHYRYIRIKGELKAPTNLKASEDGRYLTWDAVEGASRYVIYVNGEKRFESWESSYEHYGEIKNGDKVQIMATADNAYDSELSSEYTFVQPKLNQPVVSVNGSIVSWEYVENASGYTYTVNGGEERTVSGTYIRVYESGVVRIKAIDENGIYLDSEWVSVEVTVSSADKEK